MATDYIARYITSQTMTHDGRKLFESYSYQLWRIEEDAAYRTDVTGELDRHSPVDGEHLLTTLQKRYPRLEFSELKLPPGEYYPRMARPQVTSEVHITYHPTDSKIAESPGYNPDPDLEFSSHSRVRSTGQLHALIQELDQICRVVHPFGDNLQAYGHSIRNLLKLAFMEVEAHWKAILRANEYPRDEDKLNTNDYVKLLKVLRLDEFVVSLNYYPWLKPISPFVCWSENPATKSLSWYDAYNSTKHDRELNFQEATLRRALAAITGCFVMLSAQYGLAFAVQGKRAEREFFRLIRAPTWHPSEYYVNQGSPVAKPYFRQAPTA